MILNEEGLKDREQWKKAGFALPEYDREKVRKETREHPFWIHFGAGNIVRAFQAQAVQKLLNEGVIDRGLIIAEGYDYEIIDKVNRQTDDYSILVTLCVDGSIKKTVVGSVVESLHVDTKWNQEYERLKDIFSNPSLQMVSFTITEKGYSLTKVDGTFAEDVKADFMAGPKSPVSYMGKTTALLYERYLAGRVPVAMVSMDNCSHNGSKLFHAVHTIGEKWVENGLIDGGFLNYIEDPEQVSFPWTMIDKITPRPDKSVEETLKNDGLQNMEGIVTSKFTYTAPFVNAEESEYLVIEDRFPNGRPELERAGFYFTDGETVDKTEKMKVCTCLNPLHTTLAIFGCLLNHSFISEVIRDEDVRVLTEIIGYQEGLPVVVDPGIIRPEEFLETVLKVRIPNPYMPDTPMRIATDTSQKLAIRFGETIRAYEKSTSLNVSDLEGIPLVFAGWLRYLLAVDDQGVPFECSPDPMLVQIREWMQGVAFEHVEMAKDKLSQILSNAEIFGVDLYKVGLGDKVCDYFIEMAKEKGAVRKVLHQFAFTHIS